MGCRLFLRSILCVILLLLPVTAFSSVFQEPFTRIVKGEDIQKTLTAFAREQGFSATLSPSVSGNIFGEFIEVRPEQFLDGITAAYNILWYVYNSKIYFYTQDDLISERIVVRKGMLPAGQGIVAPLKSFLEENTFFSPYIRPTLSPAADSIFITAPKEYIDDLRFALDNAARNAQERTVVRVFKLRHIWADDFTINTNKGSTVIPGAASILRSMASGDSSQAKVRTIDNSSTVAPLLGQGLNTGAKDVAPGQQEAAKPQQQAKPDTAKTLAEKGIVITAEPRINAVIIRDYPTNMAMYSELIRSIDIPQRLVQIQAIIVDVNVDFSRELGVNWNITTAGDLALKGTTGFVPKMAGGMDFSTIFTSGKNKFMATVRALETTGDSRVLGQPSVLTMENMQATLENTQTFYVRVAGAYATDLYNVSSGTVLRVTPSIVEDPASKDVDGIRILVHVKDGQGNSSGQTTTVDKLPVVKETTINTQAVINPGQSLLLGGYYYETSQVQDSGIPGLKDIPYLNLLFGYQKTVVKRMQRLILISPTVIDLDKIKDQTKDIDKLGFEKKVKDTDVMVPPEQQKGVVRGGCARRGAKAKTSLPSSKELDGSGAMLGSSVSFVTVDAVNSGTL